MGTYLKIEPAVTQKLIDDFFLTLTVRRKFKMKKRVQGTGLISEKTRLEQSDFNGQSIGRKMEIRLEKPAINNFETYGWQK